MLIITTVIENEPTTVNSGLLVDWISSELLLEKSASYVHRHCGEIMEGSRKCRVTARVSPLFQSRTEEMAAVLVDGGEGQPSYPLP